VPGSALTRFDGSTRRHGLRYSFPSSQACSNAALYSDSDYAVFAFRWCVIFDAIDAGAWRLTTPTARCRSTSR